MVYLGADVDANMVRMLQRSETRALFVDGLVGYDDPERNEELNDAHTEYERVHEHDLRTAYRQSSFRLRPCPLVTGGGQPTCAGPLTRLLVARLQDGSLVDDGTHVEVMGNLSLRFWHQSVERTLEYLLVDFNFPKTLEPLLALSRGRVSSVALLGAVGAVPSHMLRSLLQVMTPSCRSGVRVIAMQKDRPRLMQTAPVHGLGMVLPYPLADTVAGGDSTDAVGVVRVFCMAVNNTREVSPPPSPATTPSRRIDWRAAPPASPAHAAPPVVLDRTHMYVVVLRGSQSGNQWAPDNLPPRWTFEPRRSIDAIAAAQPITGECNATHRTTYLFEHANASRPLPRGRRVAFVHPWCCGDALIPGASERAAASWAAHGPAVHLFFAREALAGMQFSSAAGFDGVASYQRTADIWVPFEQPDDWLAWASRMVIDVNPTQRTSIGVFLDNCGPLMRRYLLDQLLATNLPVASFGTCRNTRPAQHLLSDAGQAECRKHRLQFAVENQVCDDWVTAHLYLALNCGAIPIIHTLDGVPDYDL